VAAPGVAELRALAEAGRARDALAQAVGERGDARVALARIAAGYAPRAAARAPNEDELWRLACDAALAVAEPALARRDAREGSSAAAAAERAARRAVALQPARATNLDRLGNALAMRARLARATGAPDAAVLGARADSAFAEACRLAPADGLLRVDRARAALALGRGDVALAVARDLIALYPNAGPAHALAGAALLTLGRLDEGRAALERALAAQWEEGADAERPAVEAMLRTLRRHAPAR